ncbi:heme peroxidase [Scenedesmus sp. NREL 46B-D3]|nr:heme peroxidase [Scenedesmus sp. NREL 46B-D3]
MCTCTASRNFTGAMLALLLLLLLLHAALPAAAQESQERPRYAPFDGKGNHAANPTWNAAGAPLLRYPINETGYPMPSGQLMAGVDRPSARAISVAVINSPYLKERDKSRATNLMSVVGQYATTDISKAPDSNATTDNSSQPIAVSPGDPWMSNFTESGNVSPYGTRSSLRFRRSQFVVDSAGVRQQINSVTGFVDASVVYGSSALAARRLRAGSGGLMRDDGQRGLPFNEDPQAAAEGGPAAAKLVNVSNDAKAVPPSRLRAAGFGSTNQNPGLLSLATVFLREHNRRAAEAVRLNPSYGDEEAFQYARKWVIAHWQHVVFDEYIPALLGATLPLYGGYNASTHPGIDNFFTTAAYRYGHATITDVVFRLDEHWQEHPEGHLLLSEVYYQPDKALSAGIEPLLRGYVASPRGQVSMPFSTAVQQNLFGPSHINGTDLLAINIQRGRDHGLPDYNTCRRLFGLAPATSFRNITPDAALAAKLEQIYGGNVNNVDAYVGGLAEPHVGNAHVGPLFFASIFDQFRRLRDGDWYYYKNADNALFNAQEVAEVESTGLRDLFLRNTNITELPDSIWVLDQESILGVCPGDAVGGSSNASALAGGSSSNETVAGPFMLLGGVVELVISKAADPSRLRVQLTGKFDHGFIGFGVAKADQPIGQKMVGADMVISRMVDGQPSVLDYHAIGHVPPVLDTSSGGTSNAVPISYERSGGSTVVVFERPFLAVDANGLDNPVLLQGPNTFIVSHGADDSLNYHGIDNRAVLQLNGPLFGGDASYESVVTAADPRAVQLRTQHGTLMAVNFIVVFPLGALMARQLRARWLNSLTAKAVLFYMHIAVQMCGVALATAGFIIATKDFGVPYMDVLFHHGSLGVAVLTLVYFQLLIGFVRPPAALGWARSLWQLGHAMLGRMALMLGMVNVFIGIYLFGTLYRGNIGLWGGLAAAGLAAVALLQIVGDLLERRASELLAARVGHLPAGGKPPPTNPSTPHYGDSLNHHTSTPTDDDMHPRDPNYSPNAAADDQFKPYSSTQHHFGGGQFVGPGGYGAGGFVGGVGSGFGPPGGSGLGSGLYYGPVLDDDALYGAYNQQYNPQYNQQYSQPPGYPASHSQGHLNAPAGPPAGAPASAAEGFVDEEMGSAQQQQRSATLLPRGPSAGRLARLVAWAACCCGAARPTTAAWRRRGCTTPLPLTPTTLSSATMRQQGCTTLPTAPSRPPATPRSPQCRSCTCQVASTRAWGLQAPAA